MEKDRTIGLAQSLILNMDNRTVQTAGWLTSDYCIFVYSVGQGREGYGDVFPVVFEISTATGAAMIAKREFLREVGLFDPRYFLYYDDDYLSFRTWLAGKRVVTVSGSKVCHVWGGTSKREVNNVSHRRYATMGAISLILNFYRNLSYMTMGLFIYAVYKLHNSLREIIVARRASEFWGNMSAISWILRNFRYMWGNRLKYWSKARIDERTLISRIIKIRIPTSIYLVPKLLTLYFRSETEKYEKSLSSIHQQE
jgi:GT2 family glycosyltransferase